MQQKRSRLFTRLQISFEKCHIYWIRIFGYTYIQHQSIFKRTVLIFCGYSSLFWNCWAEVVLFTSPVVSTTHFSFCLFIKDELSTWQPWALTEQEKRSVVPVRSDFWPKESNGLHKWAVVTKANISLCSAECALCSALCCAQWDVCTPRAEVVSEKLMTVSHFGNVQRGKEDVSELSGFEKKDSEADDMWGGGGLSSWKSLGFEEEKKGSDVWGGGGLSREPDFLEARSVTSPDLKLLRNWMDVDK